MWRVAKHCRWKISHQIHSTQLHLEDVRVTRQSSGGAVSWLVDRLRLWTSFAASPSGDFAVQATTLTINRLTTSSSSSASSTTMMLLSRMHEQLRWISIAVQHITVEEQRLMQLTPKAKWYVAQASRGVLRSQDLQHILIAARTTEDHKKEVLVAAFAVGKKLLRDAAHAASLLSQVHDSSRRDILTQTVLSRPQSSTAQLLPSRLLSELMLPHGTWHEAMAVCRSVKDMSTLWKSSDNALSIQLVKALATCDGDGRRTLSSLLQASPPSAYSGIASVLVESHRWALATSFLPVVPRSMAMNDVAVRGYFELGDWATAMEIATASASPQLWEMTLRLLTASRETLMACRWLDHYQILPQPSTVSLLLMQLAEKRLDAPHVSFFARVIEKLVSTSSPRNNVMLRLAASRALAACGDWAQVLSLLEHDSHKNETASASITMSLFVAAAAGGAPWTVLKGCILQWRRTFGHSATPMHVKEMVVRCAVECGSWIEALAIFQREPGLPASCVDHPHVLNAFIQSEFSCVPFAVSTYLASGRWEAAVRIVACSDSDTSDASIVRRYLQSHTTLWETALTFSRSTEERLRVILNMTSRQMWKQGIETLTQVLSVECSNFASLAARVFARKLALHQPQQAIGILQNLDAHCKGSAVSAAWMVHEDLRAPSCATLETLLPTLHWNQALILLSATTARPGVSLFAKIIADSIENMNVSQMVFLILVRLRNPRIGRCRAATKKPSRSFALLFDAQKPTPASASSLSVPQLEWQDCDNESIATDEIQEEQHPVRNRQTGVVWQRAAALLTKPISAVSMKPWIDLWDCPQGALEAIFSRSDVYFTADRLSSCVLSMSNRRQWTSALFVLAESQKRHLFVDMEALVSLVETAAELGAEVLICVADSLRTLVPDEVSSNVFRAYVERKTRNQSREGLWENALELISSCALAGFRHLPLRSLEAIANAAPGPAVQASLRLLDAASSVRQTTAPLKLECKAVLHVVHAAHIANMLPIVDVMCISKDVPLVGMMSSLSGGSVSQHASNKSTSRVIKLLYREPLPSMWHVALRLALRDAPCSPKDVYRAFALTVFGCGDGTVLMDCAKKLFRKSLIPPHHQGALLSSPEAKALSVQRTSSCRLSREDEQELLCILACELARRGEWTLGLDVVSRLSNECPRVPSIVSVSRMAILDHTGNFDDTLKQLLEGQRSTRRNLLSRTLTRRLILETHGAVAPLSWLL